MCLAEQLFFSEQWKRGRALGRDPCEGTMQRTEAALSSGATGQTVDLHMLILVKAPYDESTEVYFYITKYTFIC